MFKIGTIIASKFKIVEFIRIGTAQEEIYKCINSETNQFVILRLLPKKLSTDREFAKRFIREIRITTLLNHPSIATPIEQGNEHGQLFFTTERELGQYLDDHLSKVNTFSESYATKHIIDLAKALKYAWDSKKLLHRSICPSVILLSNNNKVVLGGFGLSKSLNSKESHLTCIGSIVGIPSYMSPEQVDSADDIDCRSDIYCLGLVFYEMITGVKAFDSSEYKNLMLAQMHSNPKSIKEFRPNISDKCINIIEKMIAKRKEDRQDSWDDLILELESDDINTKTVIVASEDKKEKIKEDEILIENGSSKFIMIILSFAFFVLLLLISVLYYFYDKI